MRVGLEGYSDGGMPQHLRDDLGVDVLREQQRGARVPEVVQPDSREPGLLGTGSRPARVRTTPELLGLFSLIALFALQRMRQATSAFRRQGVCYHKRDPTFADALAMVRKELWAQEQSFYGSPSATDTTKVPQVFMEQLTEAVCYAA